MAAEEANVSKQEKSSAAGLDVLAKSIGPVCDITCEYCFRLEKHALVGKGENFRMPGDVPELASHSTSAAGFGHHFEEGDGMIAAWRMVGRGVCRQGIRALGLVAVLVVLGIAGQVADAGQSAAQSAEAAEAQLVVGRWVRPDGGYVLEIREVTKDGGLTASYYNPRPINVAKAAWRRKDGALTVFVELRDVNYPGSTYTLQYDPASDRLSGVYYQAVAKQSYAIEFARAR